MPTAVLAHPPPAGAEDATDGAVVIDLVLDDGLITAVEPPSPRGTPVPPGDLDCDGGLVWPCFADLHTHIDKGQTVPRVCGDGSMAGALAATLADHVHWHPEDVAARADFALRCAYAHGTRALRTHLDLSGAPAATVIEVFSELRAAWRGRIELSGVAMVPPWATPDDMAAAARRAERNDLVLGGAVFAADDLDRRVACLFDLAERHGLALDLHVDEPLAGGTHGLEAVGRAAVARGGEVPLVIGHACALSHPDNVAGPVIDLLAGSGATVVALPMVNLHLQDRRVDVTPRARGVTLVRELRALGVPVALSSDNCRDAWYPYGDLDMVEVHREGVRVCHLDGEDGWEDAVTTVPARALGVEATIAPGAPADLVVFRARTRSELLSRPQADRSVFRGGVRSSAVPPDHRELDAVVGRPGAP